MRLTAIKTREFIKTIPFCLSIFPLLMGGGHAFAAGNIGFGGLPAVIQSVAQSSSLAGDKSTQQSRGVNRVILSPVTSAQADAAIKAQILPVGLISPGSQSVASALPKGMAQPLSTRVGGDSSALGPGSIAELARALKNNPDLIYEYVYNNIEYYPVWGVQKGALGALLDNQGTAFDQAALMVSLLRAAGYADASYMKGRINLTAQQVRDWLGVDTSNACAVINYLGQGQVPIGVVTGSAAGSCPGSTASLVSISVDHVWVKVTIAGSAYVFDPSFKSHTLKTPIDIVGTTGYSQSSYLTTARAGATTTADYVQSLNRNGIRTQLSTYSTNLS